ncbi:hypothetical protein QQ045_002234 [Rhodiola kirilowii]
MLRFMHKSLRFESSPEHHRHHRQPVSKSESHKQSNELDNDPLRISALSFEIRPFYPIHARVKLNGRLAYGLRQSNLLQWSCGRMLTSGGAGSGFNLIVCGVDHMVDCGFDCCEGGRRKDWSFDRVEYGGRAGRVNIARGRRRREDVNISSEKGELRNDEGLESVEDFDNDNYVEEQSSNTEFRSHNDKKNCNIVEEIERRGKKQQEVRQEGTDGRGSLEGNVVVWDRKKSENKLIKTSLDQSQSASETAHKHFKASEAYNSSYNKCDDNSLQELKEDRHQHIPTVTESKSRRKSQQITNISEINQSDIQKTSISNQQSNSRTTTGEGGSNGRVSQKRFWHSQNDETKEQIEKREHQRLAQESIYEEPLSGLSSEDALGSTERIQNSSNILMQQFVEQAKSELPVSEVQEEEKIKKTTSVSEGSMRQTMVKDAGNGSIKRPGRSLWNVTRDVTRARLTFLGERRDSRPKSRRQSSSNESVSSETNISDHEHDQNITKETEIRSSFRESASPSNLVKPEREKAVSQQVGSGAISEIDDHDMSGFSRPSGNVGSSSAVQGISSAYEEAKPLSSGPEMSILPTFSTAWMLGIPFPSMRISRSPAIGNTSLGAKDDPTTSESLDLISSPLRLTEASEPEEKEGELTRKFQRSKQVPKDRFEEWEEAFKLETEQLKIDEIFMRVEAQKSADNWEVPVGAVLVHHGKIIARGCNLVEELRDSTAHAEMICIRSASNALRTWRLAETTLYVTLEPCAMCAGAILQARVTTLVWRSDSVERDNTSELADKPTAPVHPFHPKMNIRRGILAAECAQVMQHFFQLRRQKKNKSDPPSCLPASTNPAKLFGSIFCL